MNSSINQENSRNTVMYCPHCEHCNSNSKNDYYSNHLKALTEAKFIINKGLELFILETQKVNQSVDIFVDQFKAYEGGIAVSNYYFFLIYKQTFIEYVEVVPKGIEYEANV